MSTTKRPVSEGAESLIDLYFPVLDHGFIALKDYCGSDAAIAQAARCSYGAGTKQISDDRNLIRYLVRHKHTSPLEQLEIKIHAKMPVFVARQWIRHRTSNVNEASGRYSVMPLQFYTPENDIIRAQSKTNKQGRDEPVDDTIIQKYLVDLENTRDHSKNTYINALKGDVARELARIDLPLSTYTEWYWKMDLHNLLHFLSLRCDGNAQYEIRAYANIIAGMVKMIAPIAYEAWLDYKFTAQTFSYQEMKALMSIINTAAYCGDALGGIGDCLPNPEQYKDWGEKFGLSLRETQEFIAKMKIPQRPDFTLDLASAKTPDYFKEQAQLYVPEI